MSKKVLTKELIINERIKKSIISISIIMLIFVGIVMLILIEGDINLGALFVIGLFLLVLGLGLVKDIKRMNLINRGEYTIDTDTLVDKHRKVSRKGKNKDVDYYFYFQNHSERVKTNRKSYNDSDIGDEFYLVKVDGAVYPFNSYEYELDENAKYNLYI